MNTLDLAALLLTVLLPVAWQLASVLAQALLAKLPAAKQEQLRAVIGETVAAVEQASASVPGQVKKELAVGMISAAASRAHIAVDPAELDRLIEASVYALNQAQAAQQVKAPVTTPLAAPSGAPAPAGVLPLALPAAAPAPAVP
jgi:superfamily 6 holin (LLH)